MPLSIVKTGLVSPVGLSAPASCAAFRAKLSNPVETRFIDSNGEWIMAHQVALARPWLGLSKLAKMAAMAIAEVLQGIPKAEWRQMPLVICIAEKERPGRTDGLDERLFGMIETELGGQFSPDSAMVAQGRVSVAVALVGARRLLSEGRARRVVIAATDSLLTWGTLRQFEEDGQLLTSENSDGFIPGEGAGALLVEGAGLTDKSPLTCRGIGFGLEDAHADSGEPLRAEGLIQAVAQALAEANCAMRDLDFRIADLSGPQYYFRESTLVLSRLLRSRAERFDIWHPAECTGEQGAVAGISIMALAFSASKGGYSLGSGILAHMANHAGQRAALALHCHTVP